MVSAVIAFRANNQAEEERIEPVKIVAHIKGAASQRISPEHFRSAWREFDKGDLVRQIQWIAATACGLAFIPLLWQFLKPLVGLPVDDYAFLSRTFVLQTSFFKPEPLERLLMPRSQRTPFSKRSRPSAGVPVLCSAWRWAPGPANAA
jgi:hypothetical protein